jgi:hypothetical protein
MFPVASLFFRIESDGHARILRLTSSDGTNRLTRACVIALTAVLPEHKDEPKKPSRPLIIAGNRQFFSVGAELNEIATLTGPEAYEFSAMGQALMNAIASYPAPSSLRSKATVWAEVLISRSPVITESPRPTPFSDIAAPLWGS